MRSSCALSSSRWKAWFNERAGPRRASGAVLALVTPSTWMARKTSLLSSDLTDAKNEERHREEKDTRRKEQEQRLLGPGGFILPEKLKR